MPEDGITEGALTRTELEELAALFDRFEFAFDPRSIDAKEAESEFESRLRRVFEQRVATNYSSVTFVLFHCRVKSLCRAFLKKNPP